MTEPIHNSRRQWRRVGRQMIHKDLVTLNLTPDEILAELEPNWFKGEHDSERELAEQHRTDPGAHQRVLSSHQIGNAAAS